TGFSFGSTKDKGDTTYFSITDTDGNSISVIQSNYMGFGSGIVPKGTGIVLQNRGSYFSLDPKHHNSLKPGKRTFHTLCASFIEDESGYAASLGSMGGDIQPQLHIQLMLGLMNNRKDPQSVIDGPRWAFPYTIYEKPNLLIVESDDLLNNIRGIFPPRKVKNIGTSSQLGHAQITARLPNGVTVGGSDPRGDGVSIPVN
ncbi:MAG: gamma-glutamyltransferase, partial [Thermoplasmatales archaeon]